MAAEDDIDLIVRRELFDNATEGVLLEIGAARPDFLSIGESFRKAGWRVISVEPNPAFAAQHHALGNEIYEYACADHDADDVEFVVAHGCDEMTYQGQQITSESFSSLGIRDKFRDYFETVKDRFSQALIKVKVRRIDTILQEVPNLTRLDLIAIDVEGWELECLKGFSFGPFAPRALIVENFFSEDTLANYLRGFGYALWRRLGYNEVYIRN